LCGDKILEIKDQNVDVLISKTTKKLSAQNFVYFTARLSWPGRLAGNSEEATRISK
jgi:hypothetical protein